MKKKAFYRVCVQTKMVMGIASLDLNIRFFPTCGKKSEVRILNFLKTDPGQRITNLEVHIIHMYIYKEYRSVCPLVGIGGIGTLPTPLWPASVPLPPEPGGGDTRLRVRGLGSLNSDDWRKNLVLCLLFVEIILSVGTANLSQKILILKICANAF
jgi:hypothetical protein